MNMTEFNLRAVICDVLDTTDLADPSDIADETFRRLTKGQYAAALRQSLRQMARLVILEHRHNPSSGTPSANASWKVAGAREAEKWRRYVETNRICTPDGWKILRDATKSDLLFDAGNNRRIADENVAAAVRKEKVAAALDEHGVATVGELPDDVLADLFGGES